MNAMEGLKMIVIGGVEYSIKDGIFYLLEKARGEINYVLFIADHSAHVREEKVEDTKELLDRVISLLKTHFKQACEEPEVVPDCSGCISEETCRVKGQICNDYKPFKPDHQDLSTKPECKKCGDKPRGIPAKDGGWTTCPKCKPTPEAFVAELKANMIRPGGIIDVTMDKTAEIIFKLLEACSYIEQLIEERQSTPTYDEGRANADAALKAEIEQLKNSAFCLWCGKTIEKSLAKTTEHLLECKDHPLAKRIEQLQEQANGTEATLIKFEQLAADEAQGFKAIQKRNEQLQAELKQFKGNICVAHTEDESGRCPYCDAVQLQARVAELEKEARWIPVSEIPKNDSYHIATDGSKCEWLYFNEVWFYAEDKKPYPKFFMLKFYQPISLLEQSPKGEAEK